MLNYSMEVELTSK